MFEFDNGLPLLDKYEDPMMKEFAHSIDEMFEESDSFDLMLGEEDESWMY